MTANSEGRRRTGNLNSGQVPEPLYRQSLRAMQQRLRRELAGRGTMLRGNSGRRRRANDENSDIIPAPLFSRSPALHPGQGRESAAVEPTLTRNSEGSRGNTDTDSSLIPAPLFSRSPRALDPRLGRESAGEEVTLNTNPTRRPWISFDQRRVALPSHPRPTLRRGDGPGLRSANVNRSPSATDQRPAVTLATVPELSTNAEHITASPPPPPRSSPPFTITTNRQGAAGTTAFVLTGVLPESALTGPPQSLRDLFLEVSRHPCDENWPPSPSETAPADECRQTEDPTPALVPFATPNENPQPSPSRSSMMEYARATEDVNGMRRFGGDEGEEDEVVPGGLVRGFPLAGYPRRHSSILRRVSGGEGGREGARYSSNLDHAVEEENQERREKVSEDRGTGAGRSRVESVRKVLRKSSKSAAEH